MSADARAGSRSCTWPWRCSGGRAVRSSSPTASTWRYPWVLPCGALAAVPGTWPSATTSPPASSRSFSGAFVAPGSTGSWSTPGPNRRSPPGASAWTRAGSPSSPITPTRASGVQALLPRARTSSWRWEGSIAITPPSPRLSRDCPCTSRSRQGACIRRERSAGFHGRSRPTSRWACSASASCATDTRRRRWWWYLCCPTISRQASPPSWRRWPWARPSW